MLKCNKCHKHFDEEMYNRICPKCGFYNRIPQKYDVSQYYSFGEDGFGKVSTEEIARREHEKLHQMYEGKGVHSAHEGHNPGDEHGSHETYEETSVHTNTPVLDAPEKSLKDILFGDKPLIPNFSGSKPEVSKPNTPRQVLSGTNTSRTNTSRTNPSGQNRQPKITVSKHVTVSKTSSKKSIVNRIVLVIMLACIFICATTMYFTYQMAESSLYELDFQEETAQVGEQFCIEGRLVTVNGVSRIDTSNVEGIPQGVDILKVDISVDNQGMGWEHLSDKVYAGYQGEDGNEYATPLQAYNLISALESHGLIEDEILYDSDYLSFSNEDAVFLFCVDEGCTFVELLFDEEENENYMDKITRRVVVSADVQDLLGDTF